MKWEIDRVMKQKVVNSPFELTEFDTDINDATRLDIANIKKEKEVFGIKFIGENKNNAKIVDCNNLYNFGVNEIIEEKNRKKIESMINSFNKKSYKSLSTYLKKYAQFIEKIQKLSIYTCIWV